MADKKAKKVPEWKKKEVDEIKKLTTSYKTIALINMENLPTKQLQIVKRKLKDQIKFKPAKKILITKAFEASANPKVKELIAKMRGVPALIFSNLGAFELFKLLKDNRQLTSAKPGQIAPDDIWVQAGPTPFAPGPVISELATLKIKAGVVSGKIEIKEDSLVVKKGEKVSPLAASMLSRLGIEPMQIGITMVSALEGSDLYDASVLDIDTEKFISDIKNAALDVFKLTVELGLVTADNADYLVSKAYRESRVLGLAKDLVQPESEAETAFKADIQAKLKEK
ncbi:MAG: 50S ribosomal protein L10 [Candidatus Nanoarchaeia archaeon]